MSSRFDKSLRDAWSQQVRSLPVSVFEQPLEATPLEYFSAVFGESTLVRPIVFCEALGSWENGFTVVARIPAEAGGGVGVFCYSEHHARPWGDLSLGRRIDAVLRLVASAKCAGTVLNLALALAARVAEPYIAAAYDPESLNDDKWAWALGHVVDEALNVEERAAYETLAHLSLDRGAWTVARLLTERGARLLANLPHSDEVEEEIRQAAFRRNGVTLNGHQIEKLALSEALMWEPRERWPELADLLVAWRYEHGDLGKAFHPAPPPPPERPKSAAGAQANSGFPLAV